MFLDLGEVIGKQWEQWCFGEDDGLLYAPGWRKGLVPGEIQAIPYLYALAAENRKKILALEKALADMERLCFEAEHQARYYRDLVSLEARFGLMLSRVTE